MRRQRRLKEGRGALEFELSSTSPRGPVLSDWAAPDFAGRAGSVRPLDIRGTRSTYANVTASACRTNHGRKSDSNAESGSPCEVGHLGSAMDMYGNEMEEVWGWWSLLLMGWVLFSTFFRPWVRISSAEIPSPRWALSR